MASAVVVVLVRTGGIPRAEDRGSTMRQGAVIGNVKENAYFPRRAGDRRAQALDPGAPRAA